MLNSELPTLKARVTTLQPPLAPLDFQLSILNLNSQIQALHPQLSTLNAPSNDPAVVVRGVGAPWSAGEATGLPRAPESPPRQAPAQHPNERIHLRPETISFSGGALRAVGLRLRVCASIGFVFAL